MEGQVGLGLLRWDQLCPWCFLSSKVWGRHVGSDWGHRGPCDFIHSFIYLLKGSTSFPHPEVGAARLGDCAAWGRSTSSLPASPGRQVERDS